MSATAGGAVPCPPARGVPWTARDMWIGAAIVLGGVVLAAALALAANALGAPSEAVVSVAALASGGAMLGAVKVVGLAKYRLSWDAVGWRMPADARHWWLAPAALGVSVSFAAVYALAARALGAGFLVPEELPRACSARDGSRSRPPSP